MASLELEQLMQSLITKINSIVSGGNKSLSDKSTLIAWNQPGIPFSYEELRFNVEGLGNKEKGADGVRQNILFAENFSSLVNRAPVVGNFLDEEKTQMVNIPSGNQISEYYDIFLRFSEVSHQELTEDQKERINRYRSLLTDVEEKEDILTGKKNKVVVDGKLKKAYNEKISAYYDALMSYNNLKLNALNSDDSRAVQEFALQGSLMQRKVRNAYDDWVSAGYKNEYEQIVAAIDQITRRNLEIYKSDLVSKFHSSVLSNPTTGATFYYTTIYPVRFLNDNQWTEFHFNKKEVSLHTNTLKQSAGGKAGFNWGLFSGSAETGYKSEDSLFDLTNEEFAIKFSLAQAPISRPWFSYEFLRSSGWRFSSNSPFKELSDGNIPTNAEFTAFYNIAIFVKDVTIISSSFAKKLKEHSSSLQAQASFGWGPFSISSNYSRDEKDKKLNLDISDSAVTIKGIQLIGFLCEVNPKIPNTDKNIKDFS